MKSQTFIHTTRGKLKFGNLHYRKHVDTQYHHTESQCNTKLLTNAFEYKK